GRSACRRVRRGGGAGPAALIGVGEPVRVDGGGVAQGARVLGAVAGDGREQLVAQAHQLVVDPFGGVAVAVVVASDRRHHADLVGAGDVGDALVAAAADVEARLGGVRVVAAGALVEAVDVTEADVVDLPGVLVAALGAPGEQRGGRRVVVDVLEAERGADVVVARHGGLGDGGVDVRAGRAPLVAGHAARLAAQAVDRHARRERDVRERVGGRVVAGHAAGDGGRGRPAHDAARRRAAPPPLV